MTTEIESPDPYRSLSYQAKTLKAAMARVRGQEPEQDPDPYGYLTDLEHDRGLSLLPESWRAEPDDKMWVMRRKARARRERIASLWIRGKTVADIARKVKVSEHTIWNDLAAIHQEWRETQLDVIEFQAAKDLARLDFMIDRLWPKVMKGDPAAAAVAGGLIDKRGTILGYKQGVQVDIEAYIRNVAEANGYDPDEAVSIAARIKVTL